MMRHAFLTGLLFITTIPCEPWSASARATAGETRVDPRRVAQPAATQFVAILGAVDAPGVFELAVPLPDLGDLIRLAGGTTPSASGSVRVFRAGRMMQLFLSPSLHYRLVPNDLVVVSANRVSAARNAAGAGPAAFSHGTDRGNDPAVVQLGLLNLISRPVVLDVTADQARLDVVLSLLRQSATGTGSVLLIQPGSGRQEIPLELASRASLSSGTVVVFHPDTVNVSALPMLPSTITPNGESVDPVESPAGRAPPQNEPAPATLRAGSEAPANRPSLPSHAEFVVPGNAAPIELPDRSVENPIGGIASRVAALPTAEVDQFSDSTTATENDEPAEIEEEPESMVNQPSSEASSVMSVTRGAILVLLLAASFVPIIWFRRNFRARPGNQAAAKPQSTAADGLLEQLISGSLPIVEEPLELPFESAIFGHPVRRPIYAFDREHDLPEPPHYELREPVEAALPATDSESSAVPVNHDRPRPRRVRVDRAHPRSERSVLDRVLASFEGGAS